MADVPTRAGVAGTYLTSYAFGPSSYGSSQGSGAGWFGPSQPMLPTAPPDVIGRQFDYRSGFNLDTRPRSASAIGFAELRAIADGYDLLRTVIETRKDQIGRMSWSIKSRDNVAAKDRQDPRVKKITAFLERPDGEHGWQDWLRPILEDLFVIDAPSIYMQRDRGGCLYALRQIDGATIKPVIDNWGRTPRPYTTGGETVWPVAYQQVLKGIPAVDYTTRDLLYKPRNRRVYTPYGFSPVEQILTTVKIALSRQLSTLSHFTEGNVPDAIAQLPKEWSPDQIVSFQQHWDAYFSGDLARRRRIKFIPGVGANAIHETRPADLKGDVDEWLAKLVCFAFSISPQALTKQMNRASADTQKELAEEEGLEPVLLWIESLINDLIDSEFGAPDLKFDWDNDDEADESAQLAVLTGYVAKGVMTINESRDRLGLDPLPDPEASQAMIITASGAVPLNSFSQAQQRQQEQMQANAEAAARTQLLPRQAAGLAPNGAPRENQQAQEAEAVHKFTKSNDDEPRDYHGRWTTDGGSALDDNVKKGYTGSSYQQINRELRGVRPSSGEHEETIAALDRHLDNARLPDDAILYRGVGSAAVAAWSGNLSRGSIIKDPGFASTTSNPSVAKISKAFAAQSRNNILMEISAPKGARAADISALSDDPSEKETLIARNSSFKVTSWSEKTRTLKVTLL